MEIALHSDPCELRISFVQLINDLPISVYKWCEYLSQKVQRREMGMSWCLGNRTKPPESMDVNFLGRHILPGKHLHAV